MIIYLSDNKDNFPLIFETNSIFSIYIDVEHEENFAWYHIMMNVGDEQNILRLQSFKNDYDEVIKFMEKLAVILYAINFASFIPVVNTVDNLTSNDLHMNLICNSLNNKLTK